MIELNVHKKLQSSGGNMSLDIQLDIEKGQLVTLYGESGSGKTSTLRILSGLMDPDDGEIIVNGTPWFDAKKKINLPPQRRKVGYVFQDYALFPNMTVRQNLEFALLKGQDKSIVDELIGFTELNELQHRNPQTLSGGQQQRVALARAIVQQPEILMLDEPLSALDNKLRVKLQEYILNIHDRYGLTTILVSHDIGEIIKLSDQIFELHHGNIVRKGNATEFFQLDKTSAKFRFTGEIVGINKEDVIYVISVLIGNDIVKVVSDISEAKQFAVGDKVHVGSKAFNPVIQKI